MTALQQQCAERKQQRLERQERARLDEKLRKVNKEKEALRKLMAKMKKKAEKNHLRALAAEQSSERLRRSVTEVADMDPDDLRLICALDKEGLHPREIAEKFETDMLTVVCVIEGVA